MKDFYALKKSKCLFLMETVVQKPQNSNILNQPVHPHLFVESVFRFPSNQSILFFSLGQRIFAFPSVCMCSISNSLEIRVTEKTRFSYPPDVSTKSTNSQMGWSGNQSLSGWSLSTQLLIRRRTKSFRKKNKHFLSQVPVLHFRTFPVWFFPGKF